MRYLLQLIRKYPFTTALYVVVIYLSFFTPPKIELGDARFIDKWTHFVMYGGTCGVTWIEYLRQHNGFGNKIKLFLLIWVAPIVFSGAIEWLQENCTGGRRSGDWLDLAANAFGVTLAAVFGIILAKYRAK